VSVQVLFHQSAAAVGLVQLRGRFCSGGGKTVLLLPGNSESFQQGSFLLRHLCRVVFGGRCGGFIFSSIELGYKLYIVSVHKRN
jgi:hypothetical protein